MAVTIEDAGTGIKELIDDITALKQVFAPNELPLMVNLFPCALVIPGAVNYLETIGGGSSVTFRILVLLAPIDSKVGMDTVLPFIEKSGTNSIPAKIKTDPTLGGRGYAAIVRSCSGITQTNWGTGNYLTAEFEVLVRL